MTAKILVVDDEADVEDMVVQSFRRQIRKGEIDFVFARDGQEALEILAQMTGVDMVLSDINMPGMDGLTLLGHLREGHGDLQTVIVSAYGDMANIRTAMNRGAFDFVTKPIEIEDLEVTIEKTLEHIRLLRDLNEKRQQAEQAQATLSHYFSPNVAEALAHDPSFLKRDGARRFVTFLFTDLADFTPLVESTEVKVVMTLLNHYLDQIAKIVFEHDGTVMKFVGDAVHAMFGAPLAQPDHPKRAVDCALAIDRFAAAYKAEKNAEGIALGDTRIGVNSGKTIVGTFGGDAFFDYTAHGDAINIAARLEEANKHLGTRICVSESTVAEIPGFMGRPAGRLLLKGKSSSFKTYEPLDAARFAAPATQSYIAAYDLLAAGDSGASQAFAALMGQCGEEPLSSFHLRRLLAGERGDEVDLSGG